ncbi:hypothetical protein [Glycomyces paridis]|uniref:Uncharacterized protein n=1 Tax=Glycomyces paridis TaxID=2126555 RepID=A0A4S8P995_9ACTN|nr:hypothetical protein [Glycomyces paridis]THV26797.1 hypothetical protein E9998_17585 [Glycomyces paridis]
MQFKALVWVDGRRLRFEPVLKQPRLRVILTGAEPVALGSVIRLDTGEPGLRVSAPLHVEWATEHLEAIVRHAADVWAEITHECEG